MNGVLLRQSLVEGATRVPATSEDLADAITRLVDRYSRELATSGMPRPDIEVEAVKMVARGRGPTPRGNHAAGRGLEDSGEPRSRLTRALVGRCLSRRHG